MRITKTGSVVIVYSAVIICALYIACNEGTISINRSPTDLVVVTDINKYLTESDLEAGISKTNGYVSPVTMPHRIHENAGVACKTCHHKYGNDERRKQCALCHKGSEGDTVIHNLCLNCHMGKKKGPLMCHECHRKGPE